MVRDTTEHHDPLQSHAKRSAGQSLESRSHMDDARAISGTTPGELLNVYRLVPAAAPDDPNWDSAPALGEIVVAARTSGDARVVAAASELDFMEIDALPAEDVTTAWASAFRNERLYTVVEIEHGRRDLVRGVLEGTVRVDTIRPTQV